MPSLIKLKQDIQFNDQLGGLLNVMKSIAAQQFQVLEKRWLTNPAFFEVTEVIGGTFNLEGFDHPFTKGTGPTGVVAVTSDTGLLGGLNQQVVTMAMEEFDASPGELIVVGKKGAGYVQEQHAEFHEFPGVKDETRGELAGQIRDYILNGALKGRFGTVTIVYPRALSFTVHRVEAIRALPCQGWLTEKTPRGVQGGAILMESTLSSVVEYLAWLWIGEKLFDVLGSARLAELAARSVHLEGSVQELGRRKSKLRHQYFRQRREVIDRGMRELFAAKSIFRGEPAETPGEQEP